MSGISPGETEEYMQFFASAINTLQTLVIALGAGLGVWGVVNLLEAYKNKDRGSVLSDLSDRRAGSSTGKPHGKSSMKER